MNRVEQELAKKREKLRENPGDGRIQRLDRVESLARDIHHQLFPEEYDYMMDSIADANDRRRGINPMNPEYTMRVNTRRAELGAGPLGENGMPTDNKSWDIATARAIEQFEK